MRDGWTETTLEEIAEVEMGQSPPGNTYNSDGVGLPFMQGSAEFGDRFPTPVKWCTAPAKIAEPGDLLLSVRAPVGDSNLANQRIAIGRGLACIRGTVWATTEFLALSIQTKTRELLAASGMGMFASITSKNLKGLVLSLPPLEEQRRIVDVVTSVDTYIDALKDKVAKARTARNAVLHELLSAGGPDWTETTLGDVAEIIMGRQLSPSKKLGVRPRPYLRAANIGSWGIDIDDVYEMDFTESEEQQFSLKIDDILLVEGGNEKSVGCPAIVSARETGLCIQNTLIRCRVRSREIVFPRFLFQLLRSHFWAGEFGKLCTGTTIMHLGHRRAVSLELKLPPLEEQRRIVDVVSSMDDVITASEKAVAEAVRLRSGLLSDLLSGEHEIPASYDSLLGAA